MAQNDMILRRLIVPARLRLGRRGIGIDRAAFWLAAIGTLVIEILIMQLRLLFLPEKPVRSVDMFGEIVSFWAALGLAHLCLVYAAYRALRWLHGRRGRQTVLAFNFLFSAIAASLLLFVVKLRLSAAFGDGLDPQVIAALGGGSLLQAALYVRQEAFPLAGCLLILGLAYLILRRLLDLSRSEPLPTRPRKGKLRLTVLLAPPALFAAGGNSDVRPALDQFSAPWLLYALLNKASDVDRDGYSLFSSAHDTFALDSRRHPFALDVPGNGVDEDGLGGDLAAFPPASPVRPVFPGAKKHVVLIVLESMRADAIGKRWGGGLVAPNLTRLAKAGSSAPEAYSIFGVTSDSLKTIFSGRISPGPQAPSLFRDFDAAGYRVGVLSSQSESFAGIATMTGMRESSDIFVDARSLAAAAGRRGHDMTLTAPGEELLREMDRRLGSPKDWSVPTFLYFNFQSAHYPYDGPEMRAFLPGPPIPRARIGRSNREWVARTYWNAVANADWLVGGVIGRLKQLGVYEETVVAIVGDHGEELYERGLLGHGYALNHLQTQVPMIFSTPGIAFPRPIGLDGLRSHILAAAGASVPQRPDGIPVFQYIGRLDRPLAIGMIEQGGRRTVLELPSENVRISGERQGVRYRDLAPNSPVKKRADRLVALWGRHRWERRLAGETRPVRKP